MPLQKRQSRKSFAPDAGKREEGPAPGPSTVLRGAAERTQPATGKSIQELYRATPGSAGLDLCASTYTVLTPEMGMQALPTGVYGPLPKGTMVLILGRSSIAMKGLHVAPGVIDEDYTGEIRIMTHSPTTISVIKSGQRIAQLLLIPYSKAGRTATSASRGRGGFGSSDVYWVQAIKAQRPELVLTINGKKFRGVLDTGADVSVIADQHWPSSWPKQSAMTQLQGIGQANAPEQSSNCLQWKDDEGHEGTFQPYIIPGLPVNLWGRDVMLDMGVYIYSPSAAVSQQMFDQGLLPTQGLGRQNQGGVEPIIPQVRPIKAGLGYF